MTQNSKIEWTDHTFNPWVGCQKVSPGCDNCYAESMMADRLKKVQWGPGAERVRTSPANWKQPLAWNAAHEKFFAEHGRRQRVFCASLADVFDNAVDPQWRDDLFTLIEQTPNIDWLLLTKRIGNVWAMVCRARSAGWLIRQKNVHIGATITSRKEMLRDAAELVDIPAHVRFWSVEPMLADLGEIPLAIMPEWVICGGESGPGARPMHPDWVRSLRDQCAAADVPMLFKQWGEWLPVESNGSAINGCGATPDKEPAFRLAHDHHFTKVGKKAAGRLLDGVQHDGFPGGEFKRVAP
jgi:protein gp37